MPALMKCLAVMLWRSLTSFLRLLRISSDWFCEIGGSGGLREMSFIMFVYSARVDMYSGVLCVLVRSGSLSCDRES